MSTLIIVESPKKAKTLNGFLGPEYRAVASRGHIRDLPERQMGIDPETYEMTYEVPEPSKVDALRTAVRAAKHVLLATDPDREGEAIAWHLADELGLAPGTYQRISYNAVEKSVVLAAIAAPRDIDYPRVRAQEARRALDRLCGYRVSGPLSGLVSQQVSAGRVQSPAVAILVRRELEIQNFTATDHFGIELTFPGGWRAEWDTAPHLQGGAKYVQDQQLAMGVAAVKTLAIAEFVDAPTRKGPKAPFTTSTMQQAASSKLRMKTKATMDAAQSLCDSGHITYHRTDCPNVIDVTYARMAEFYQAEGIPMAAAQRVWKVKDGAQEAHDPCIPTDFSVREVGKTPEEKALYKLIWQRAVASQMPDAVYATRRVILTGTVDGVAVRFVASGSTLTEPGWRAVYEEQEEEDAGKGADAPNPIPALCAGDCVSVEKVKVQKKKTKAPKRYTEGSLVAELEEQGIGRPSTYAAIMTTITERGYSVPDNKGFLRPTPLAFAIVSAMTNRFSFIELDYTRTMEADLDRIAQGTADFFSVVAAADARLSQELGAIEAAAPKHPCPTCGELLRRKMSKATPTRPSSPFWGCSGYPECECTVPDVGGAPLSAYPCPACASPLRRVTGTTFNFFRCTAHPGCSTELKCSATGAPMMPGTKGASKGTSA